MGKYTIKTGFILSCTLLLMLTGHGCQQSHIDMANEIYEEGKLLDLYGHSDLAVEKYRRAVAVNPDSIKARLMLAQAYMASGRVDLARQEFDSVVKLDSSYAKAYIWLGNIDFRTGNYDEALKKWCHAAEMDSKLTDTSGTTDYQSIGLAYVQEKKHELTDSRWQNYEFRKSDTEYVDVYGWLGQYYFNRKDYKKAIAEWEKVVKRSPDSFSGIQAKANIEETKKLL